MSDWAYWVRRNILGQTADKIVKGRYGGRLEVCRKAVFVVRVLGKDGWQYEDDKIQIAVSTEEHVSAPEYHDVTIYNQADGDSERMWVFQDRWERIFEYRQQRETSFWRRGFWMEHLDYMYKVAQEREISDHRIKNAPIMTEIGYEE